MNQLLNAAVLTRRTFSTSARWLKNKVPEAQKRFQEDNGLPVHIKGGTGDVMLYRATMTLTAEPATPSTGCSWPLLLGRTLSGDTWRTIWERR
ncbi:unnamed protein product [Tetraodon nigroviridis]|uniref:Cytochrome c oxidase subunit 7A1, mitochondrial n=1 Tax=Tetraodon nigroviridis TaxID=99883 RepID=Q4SB76_TETNG|nr:unnamed protein product [Tetraodon nigroviridis]